MLPGLFQLVSLKDRREKWVTHEVSVGGQAAKVTTVLTVDVPDNISLAVDKECAPQVTRVDQIVVTPLLNRVHMKPVKWIGLVGSGIRVLSCVDGHMCQWAPDKQRLVGAKVKLNSNRVINPTILGTTQRGQISLGCVVRSEENSVIFGDEGLVNIRIAICCGTSRHGQVELQTHRLEQLVLIIVNLYLTPPSASISSVCRFSCADPECDYRFVSPVLLTEVGRVAGGSSPNKLIVICQDEGRYLLHTCCRVVFLANKEQPGCEVTVGAVDCEVRGCDVGGLVCLPGPDIATIGDNIPAIGGT